jgi:hypothetical protein
LHIAKSAPSAETALNVLLNSFISIKDNVCAVTAKIATASLAKVRRITVWLAPTNITQFKVNASSVIIYYRDATNAHLNLNVSLV